MDILRNKAYLKEDSTLRPYQTKAKNEIYSAWESVDDVMFQMPTGTGKTRLFTSIIKDINDISIATRTPVKILIVAHRKELIDQIDESLKKYHIAHSLFVGNKDRRDSSFPVLVTSVQTISHPHNADERKALRDKVKFIIIDEAHHAVAKTYSRLWHCFPKAKILGVTATPYRLSHEGFTKLFKKLILSPSVKQFINEGWLSPYSYYSLRSTSYVQKTIDNIDEFDSFGDYKESALERAMDKDKIRAQLVESYQKYAKGKKGIIYSINRLHSEHICEKYAAIGLRVAAIDAQTPKGERQSLVEDFKRGNIDILVNVNIFSEGFDCPDIEFIQLARPTKSLSMYLQQVGRGLRITQGKTNCIILDNVGMYARFGLPDAKRMWNHHFIGAEVEEVENKTNSSGNCREGSEIKFVKDLSEGSEQMFLIQDAMGNIHTEEESALPNAKSPIDFLKEIGYTTYGYTFLIGDHLYEAYVQDRGQFIINQLNIDEVKREVHRIRVGRIPPSSWAFERFEKEHVNNLFIKHYEGSNTLFTWTLTNENKGITVYKHYDYLGKEVADHSDVTKQYLLEKEKKSDLTDHVDLSVRTQEYFAVDLGKEHKYAIVKKTMEDQKILFKIEYGTTLALFLEKYHSFEITREESFYIGVKYNDNGVIKTCKFTYDGDYINTSGKVVPFTKTSLYKEAFAKNISNMLKKDFAPLIKKMEKEKLELMEDRIMQVLSVSDGITAKELAEKLDTTRHEINSLLYGKLSSKVRKDLNFRWYKIGKR